MKYKLIVKGFGKIRKAEIQVSPLTLFVGDNNSGKSYLLSLIWALHSADSNSAFLQDLSRIESKKYNALKKRLMDYFIAAYENQEKDLILPASELVGVLNDIFMQKKETFVAEIFNDLNVKIDVLQIELLEDMELTIKKVHDEEGKILFSYFNGYRIIVKSDAWQYDYMADFLIRRLMVCILNDKDKNSIFLPAARTGFMLAKDVINKAGRQETFGVISGSIREDNKYEAFTKPIIEFLNTLEELNLDYETDYRDLVDWIESDMVHGSVKYEETLRREVQYLPKGKKETISLRTASAVVSELSPLVLILKYHPDFYEICYEEPEMCLHPQLQLEMGKLLIRMINEGKGIVATTHSDIIIQHINNMCKIFDMGISQELIEKYGLTKKDIISAKDVAIYQLKDDDTFSSVERIPFEDGTFHVQTFTDALMNILEQTTEIQNFEG